MKRILSGLLILSLLAAMSGCGLSSPEQEEGLLQVTFYYAVRDAEGLESDETVAAEERYVTPMPFLEFLELYVAGPESEDLASPFPSGTAVLDVESTSDGMTIVLSMEFFTLTGVEMTIAKCCIANTVCNYANLDKVILSDEMGSIHLEISPDQYLLSNSLQEIAADTYTLYFADSDSRYLIAETRDATLSENETAMAYVLRKLLEGPESSQLQPVIPEGTELLGVTLEDGVCTVNFSNTFYTGRTNETYPAYMTIYSVVNTLTGLEGIDSVQFLRNGETVSWCGIFPLRNPIERNESAIGPVRTAGGEVDINIFVCSESGKTWFAVPCRVLQTVSEPLAYAVTAQVLSFEPPVGFYNPIPEETEVLNITVSGSICYVDLSSGFIPADDTEISEERAVRALVESLTDLSGVSSVVLTIDGENGGLKYVDISEPLTAQNIPLRS